MRKIILLSLLSGFTVLQSQGQLKIDNAVFYIGSGATVTVQGDVTSNVDIQGPGTLLLKGSALQNVDMGGFTIPNLELDNAAHATLLNSGARIGNSFVFTNGKFQTANFNLTLAPLSTITGANSTRFVNTNGTGLLRKELNADISAFELPVGEGNNYRPAYLANTGSAYASAIFGVRVTAAADANKPPTTAAHLNTSWPVTRSGITGGTTTLAGQYLDPTDVAGTEANIFGYYFNNATGDWSSVGETHNTALNRVSAPVTSAAGVVSGINKFLAVGSRAFLQGAYQAPITTAGLMNDNLRTLPHGVSTNLANFPMDDPYRQAPYAGAFTHVSNTNVETIPHSGILGAQADPANNIVDWVFLQLRNLDPSPGNDVLQTRSALIQRDGDIVDVDGVSPVTFNNMADGNYILTVRHRNHLGLSLDQTAFKNFTETKSLSMNVGRIADLKNATDADLFGNNTAYTSISLPGPITVRALWGGNANVNTNIRYSAAPSDPSTIFTQVTTFPGNVTQAYNYIGMFGYYSGDCNMNRNVRYSASQSDQQIIFNNVTSLNPAYNFIGLVQQIQN